MSLMDMLQQYVGADSASSKTPGDFEQAAHSAPRGVIATGLAAALRSDATPPVPEMVAKLFGQSTPDQRAGMLRELLGSIPPDVASGVLGGLLGTGQRASSPSTVTPDQAAQVMPEQVHDAVAKLHEKFPRVVDRLSAFYAQHPDVVKTLGNAALSVALAKIAEKTRP